MNNSQQYSLIKAAKYSLSFLWIFTGITSIYLSPEIGYEILNNSGITGPLADTAVYAGGILDIILGLWILTAFKLKLCCIVQVMIIGVYTVLLTFIEPSFWWHPFGPITKNFPIIVLIAFIYSEKATSDNDT
ncbi:DoxX-like family protein [Pseudocolwellia sp. HL-MZ7]|uniref:DoxX-like family protein n=1 Tax=Pseudocolwellia sp. HL-MZ7 TaxID=3400627 RepID=UPI003CF497B6